MERVVSRIRCLCARGVSDHFSTGDEMGKRKRLVSVHRDSWADWPLSIRLDILTDLPAGRTGMRDSRLSAYVRMAAKGELAWGGERASKPLCRGGGGVCRSQAIFITRS